MFNMRGYILLSRMILNRLFLFRLNKNSLFRMKINSKFICVCKKIIVVAFTCTFIKLYYKFNLLVDALKR